MGEFHKMRVGEQVISPIDWEMNPSLSFGTYESWGGRERVRNNQETIYYFFIDNWGDEPKLCLMERAVKHAKIVAEIRAPLEIVKDCVAGQGKSAIFEKSYAINEQVKQWLIDNVLDGGDGQLVVPCVEEEEHEDMGPQLPLLNAQEYRGEKVVLPSTGAFIDDQGIGDLVRHWGFFDAEANPGGRFDNALAAAEDPEVLVDQKTGLMWQRRGLDIGSIRLMHRSIAECNETGFAGYADWRLPTMEEALSLLEPVKNDKGLYLHACFSKEQPFIFVDAQRKPGGYWFVDFKQGRAFWSSGTIPGGFGRLVRTV